MIIIKHHQGPRDFRISSPDDEKTDKGRSNTYATYAIVMPKDRAEGVDDVSLSQRVTKSKKADCRMIIDSIRWFDSFTRAVSVHVPVILEGPTSVDSITRGAA